MKKKWLTTLAAAVAALTLTACGIPTLRQTERAVSEPVDVALARSAICDLPSDPIDSPLGLENIVDNRDAHGYAVTTCSFDSINISVLKDKFSPIDGTFAVSYPTNGLDASGAEYLAIEYENSTMVANGEQGFQVRLWTDAGECVNQSSGTYYLADTRDGQGTPTGLLYANFFQPPAYSGWIKIPVELFPTADFSDIGAIDISIDVNNQPYCKVNFGRIGFLTADGYIPVVDPKTVSVTRNNTPKAGAVCVTDVASVRVTQVAAGEVFYDRSIPFKDQSVSMGLTIPSDISEYVGIRFYVDTTYEDKALYLEKFFIEKNWQETWYNNNPNYYALYYPEDATQSEHANAFVIPAGFKGHIAIPFSTFFSGWGSNVNGYLDLVDVIPLFYFVLRQGDANPSRFRLTDFAFVKANKQTAYTTGDVKVFMPFEYETTEQLRMCWDARYMPHARASVRSVFVPSSVQGVRGKAMEFTCGGFNYQASASDSSFMTALDWSPTDKQAVAIGDAKGFTFWVKNTSRTSIAFGIGFDLKMQRNGALTQRWETSENARYLLIDTKTGTEHLTPSKSGIYIPAGFEGWVRIGFEQFALSPWATVMAPFDPDNELSYMVINMFAPLYEGDSFILDSLGYYYSDIDVTTPFHTPENSFAAAMRGEEA